MVNPDSSVMYIAKSCIAYARIYFNLTHLECLKAYLIMMHQIREIKALIKSLSLNSNQYTGKEIPFGRDTIQTINPLNLIGFESQSFLFQHTQYTKVTRIVIYYDKNLKLSNIH